MNLNDLFSTDYICTDPVIEYLMDEMHRQEDQNIQKINNYDPTRANQFNIDSVKDLVNTVNNIENKLSIPVLSSYYSILLNTNLVDESINIQRRHNKNHRINKKWIKKYGYYHPPINKCYLVGYNTIMMHPLMYKKLKKNLTTVNLIDLISK